MSHAVQEADVELARLGLPQADVDLDAGGPQSFDALAGDPGVGIAQGGDDTPDPYANEDGENNHRVYWSRNSSKVDFDDTSGAEKVSITATTEGNAITVELDAANKKITVKSEKDLILQAVETFSVKCKTFKVEAQSSVSVTAGKTLVLHAKSSATV